MDIIHLLPDEVANQIAAGEVVQRPASVIKELVENSIDAGAQHIQIILKDAGRTLIQVIDDGKGMSPTDARMAFERHATSKIKQATDLYSLHTMGFRGEALASIAAVAQVELLTKQSDAEMGTSIHINGGIIESQEPVTCPKGCNFSIKNLFYNIPARRKFLKSNATEFGHIEKSFCNIALVYPEISFELIHNDQRAYSLPATNLRERICNVFGRSLNAQLFNINGETSIINIKGFIGKPETAKKQNTDKQFFFINGRYMKHPGFHKAVMQAYERMLQPGTSPCYFIYLEAEPSTIDVNVHPTKTEIKFENEQQIWPILKSVVSEALGKFDASPSIDFNQTDAVDIPSFLNVEHKTISAPQVHINSNYNPFDTPSQSTPANSTNSYSNSGSYGSNSSYGRSSISSRDQSNLNNWDKLYDFFESSKATDNDTEEQTETDWSAPATDGISSETLECEAEPVQQSLDLGIGLQTNLNGKYIQYKNKYIITPAMSGLMCIDQHRAHFRILYDKFLAGLENHKNFSQRLLYPEQIELSPAEAEILEEIKEDLTEFGYDIANFGNNQYVVNAVPAENSDREAKPFITSMIEDVKGEDLYAKDQIRQKMAMALARTVAIPAGKPLQQPEMSELINSLFACPMHSLTPDNKHIIAIIGDEELDKKFK